MPITITLPEPDQRVGPGLGFSLQSTFIGPLPSNEFWNVIISSDSEGLDTIWQESFPAPSPLLSEWWQRVYSFVPQNLRAVAPGTTVHVIAELKHGATVDDSGSATAIWDPTTGLGTQAQLIAQQQVFTGGFTSTDRSTMTTGLADILNGITSQIQTASGLVQHTLGEMFSRQTLDTLTLQEITDGETFDPVSAGVGSWFFGVIVRVTTIPDAYAPRFVDSEWRYNDLAVLRVFRGADLEYRKGIHTPTWLAPAPWGYNLQLMNIAFLDTPPPDTTILVDWALGCGGQVFLMAWP